MRNLTSAPSDRAAGQSGFSLVESLVACGLTLVVVTAALGALNQSMRLADTSRIGSETNQGLQVAMTLLVRDLLQAGQGIPIGGIPVPTGAGSSAIVRPSAPNTALTFPGAWTTLPAVMPGSSLGPTVLGVQTDLITLLYADTTIALNEYPLVDINGNANHIRVDLRTPITGPDGLKVGDLLMFSNALGNALRMITHIPGGPHQQVNLTPTDPLGLNLTNAAQGTILCIETGPNKYPPTTATRILMITYYIDRITDPDLPRLVRQVNAGPRLAIALGAENLQFSFDLVDGTVNPTNVDEPPAGQSANQIRKVNIYLAARSLDQDPRSRQFFRNSMATQVGLRSLSFVDRYQ
jgi:type II secretory pathway pseudopilin PulG